MFLPVTFFRGCALACFILASGPALAAGFGDTDAAEFETASALPDSALDSMRGGALQIGGMMIDYSYFAQLQTHLDGQIPQVTDLISFSTNNSQPANQPVASLAFNAFNNNNISESGASVNLNQVIEIVISGLGPQANVDALRNPVILNALTERQL